LKDREILQTVKVPQLAWDGPRDLDLELPDGWQVQMCYMAGYNRLELKPEDILAVLKNPEAVLPLCELAKGKRRVAIVFDDMTRATRVSKIIRPVLAELAAAGISDDNISLICGLGTHGVVYRQDLVKKLGEDIVSHYRVFNHNAFGNCLYVGTTSTFQTKVYINEEYLKADLKIAIGACVPHGAAGFGGGGKIIMPGIASFETVNWHHKKGHAQLEPATSASNPFQGMGITEGNLFKQDLEEAADLAGIDFFINVLLNLWGETVSIYAGDWKKSFAGAQREAFSHYRTPKCLDNEVVIANSYAKASESMISLPAGIPLISQKGGDLVVIANAPEGQVTHYLAGVFGKNTYACQYGLCAIPDYVKHVIIYSEYPHPGSSWFEKNEKTLYMERWSDVLALLQKNHGPGTRTGVIPDATNQYFAWYD
jgi:lactate racemase